MSDLSLQNEKTKPLVWAAVAVIIALAFVPFIQNYKFNDNHLAWLNHDYAKNLMTSTEEGSIYMTEGGDNQVFGSLYFIYAEKIRTDLTPYDQKGNIFKRIYGDMRYIDPRTLDRRMKLVDTHLFAGDEPFYVNIRSAVDPYFVPYWQGRRPVYLTWQRPDPWTLSMEPYQAYDIKNDKFNNTDITYGDYYYKRYGIMYKVQNIEYALVDFLEVKKEISLTEAQAQLTALLHRPVDMNYTMDRIQKMQKAGFLQIAGNTVRFVKMYDAPHKKGYFENMLLRWKQVPNSKYWDTLTREIVINYDMQLGDVMRDEISSLKDIRSRETRKAQLADIDRRIAEKWKQALDYYNDAIVYGSDSISVLHNISVVFWHNGIQNMDDQALDLMKHGLDLYKNSWGTYSLLMSFLVSDMLSNPDHSSRNLSIMDHYFAQLKKQLGYYRSSNGDYTRNAIWKNFAGLEGYVNELKKMPPSQFQPTIDNLDNLLKSDPAKVTQDQARSVLEYLYTRGYPFQFAPYLDKAESLYQKIYPLFRNDQNFLAWAFGISSWLQKSDRLYTAGKDLERITKGGITDPGFYYSMGAASMGLNKKAEAVSYMNQYLNKIKEDRNAAVSQRVQIENAQNVIKAASR